LLLQRRTQTCFAKKIFAITLLCATVHSADNITVIAMKSKTDKNENKCSTEENPAASSQSNAKSWQLLALLSVPIAVQGFYIYSPVFTMDVPDYKCLDNETEVLESTLCGVKLSVHPSTCLYIRSAACRG